MAAMETLSTWISKNSTRAKFAREVGCSEPHLSNVLSGKKAPSFALAQRMSAATNGDVSLDEMAPSASVVPDAAAASAAEIASEAAE